MAIGDLDDGTRFGLPAIGLPQANLGTQGSDTERRAMPGLATKNSVFSWVGTPVTILSRGGATGSFADSINLRNNTALNGVSVDVPAWAAGCVVSLSYRVLTMGTSTYHLWGVTTNILNAGTTNIFSAQQNAVKALAVGDIQPVIVPFYDEPIVTVSYVTDGTGTGTYLVQLIGFVRNV